MEIPLILKPAGTLMHLAYACICNLAVIMFVSVKLTGTLRMEMRRRQAQTAKHGCIPDLNFFANFIDFWQGRSTALRSNPAHQ